MYKKLVKENLIEESKQTKIIFVRFGNLNVQKYDKYIDNEFHKPPVKYGVFAFIWPYIEPFLYTWKFPESNDSENAEDYNKRIKKWKRINYKKFEYSGYIWTHFTDFNIPGRRIGSWIEIHTDDLNEIMKKQKHQDIKQLYKYGAKQIIDPYKKGLGGYMSRDHLEVFIEKIK
jgi:hypothetical protein